MQSNFINENDFNNMFNLYAFTLACNQTGLTESDRAFKNYSAFLHSRIKQHEFVLREFENITNVISDMKNLF